MADGIKVLVNFHGNIKFSGLNAGSLSILLSVSTVVGLLSSGYVLFCFNSEKVLSAVSLYCFSVPSGILQK